MVSCTADRYTFRLHFVTLLFYIKQKKIITGFLVVNVFDISQTEGESIPEICTGLLDGSSEAIVILEALKKVIKIEVKEGNTGTAKGYYHKIDNFIMLSDKATDSQKAKTLAHEYAHALLDHKDAYHNRNRAEREMCAESVAYIVCDYFGFKTGEEYSFPYLASWSRGGRDIEKLIKLGEVIQKTSSQIIDELEKVIKKPNLLEKVESIA